MLDESYTRVMASGIVKAYLDDFFRNNFQVDDRNMVSYKDDVKKGNLNSLMKAVSQDLKSSIDIGFKDRLHDFLRQNIRRKAERQWTQAVKSVNSISVPKPMGQQMPIA